MQEYYKDNKDKFKLSDEDKQKKNDRRREKYRDNSEYRETIKKYNKKRYTKEDRFKKKAVQGSLL